MAPGAEVREQPDGSVSVKGVLHAAARGDWRVPINSPANGPP